LVSELVLIIVSKLSGFAADVLFYAMNMYGKTVQQTVQSVIFCGF